MLKIRVIFLEIVNGQPHVHEEKIGQIVVSCLNLTEHFLEVLCHRHLNLDAYVKTEEIGVESFWGSVVKEGNVSMAC